MILPETEYTNVDDDRIGYQIVGDGPIDVVFVPGVASNIETIWDGPLVAVSEFSFEDRGFCTLKAVPDQWQLYAVRHA